MMKSTNNHRGGEAAEREAIIRDRLVGEVVRRGAQPSGEDERDPEQQRREMVVRK
jgi:hypothetical protein